MIAAPTRLLLDTHILLWALLDSPRLGAPARAMIADAGSEVLFSAVSVWEVAIKHALGRRDFPFRPERVAAQAAEDGYAEVPVTSGIASRVAYMPLHHRDPFDRLIVAQALHLPARLLTADPALRAYSSELVVLAA